MIDTAANPILRGTDFSSILVAWPECGKIMGLPGIELTPFVNAHCPLHLDRSAKR